jgi:dCTP diphosphatase
MSSGNTPGSPDGAGLERLRDALRRFAAERDWDQFHSPKNLAAALSVEAAELLECFQWLTEAESRHLSPEQYARVREELADVLNYLVRLADKLDVDLLAAAEEKLRQNALKYPVDKARGHARKYSELEADSARASKT